MAKRILVGYTVSWAGHMVRWLRGEKDPEPQPVYISREKHRKLRELEELQYYLGFLQ